MFAGHLWVSGGSLISRRQVLPLEPAGDLARSRLGLVVTHGERVNGQPLAEAINGNVYR